MVSLKQRLHLLRRQRRLHRRAGAAARPRRPARARRRRGQRRRRPRRDRRRWATCPATAATRRSSSPTPSRCATRAADEATGTDDHGASCAPPTCSCSTRRDLVDAEQLARTHAWLREIAGPSTAIVETSFGAVPVDVVLGAQAGAPGRGRVVAADAPRGHDHGHGTPRPRPHPDFETWSWSGPAPISGAGPRRRAQGAARRHRARQGPAAPARGSASRYVLQLVGRRFSIEADRPWGDATPGSQLVVIGLPGSVDAARADATLERLTAAPGA